MIILHINLTIIVKLLSKLIVWYTLSYNLMFLLQPTDYYMKNPVNFMESLGTCKSGDKGVG